MHYLGKWLSANSICPKGYVIDERTSVYARGTLHNIT